MKKFGKFLKTAIAVILICAILYVIIWADNKTIVTTSYTVSSEEIPQSFDGFKIVQVSDLHNDLFGENNADLISAIEASEPDIIVLTGDIMDSYDTQLQIACDFVESIAAIAPIYFVTGNHEGRYPSVYAELENCMTDAGVTVLRGESAEIELNGESITICGIDDPNFTAIEKYEYTEQFFQNLTNLIPQEGYTILLSHRPEIFEIYAKTNADLVLSGHAHGGQIRLPVLGGVLVPAQGFFPLYEEGMHEKDGTTMIISRGLGNSSFPLRVNNPPELVALTLEAK